MGRVEGRVMYRDRRRARGIGRAIGEALLDEGAKVCFADLNGDKVARWPSQSRRLNGVPAR
jgi:meso-butanediol dehydrogenase/(S,S)-butanediol dehydrogenase/diacetyl reductase